MSELQQWWGSRRISSGWRSPRPAVAETCRAYVVSYAPLKLTSTYCSILIVCYEICSSVCFAATVLLPNEITLHGTMSCGIPSSEALFHGMMPYRGYPTEGDTHKFSHRDFARTFLYF